jgi:uncharacterized protein
MSPLSRHRPSQATGVTAAAGRFTGAPAAQAAVAPVRAGIGAAARSLDLGQARLTSGRWPDDQNRSLSHPRFVDVD